VREDRDADLDDLILRVDLDGLVRMVDNRCATRDWAGILRLRDRCSAAAADTGRQLWPAATLAEYRLALLAPPEWAAALLDGESGRFTIGPLSEVVAMNHTWAELAPHLSPVPIAMFVAHERAIRGEPINPIDLADVPPVLDIPAALQPWEPGYPLSVYSDAGAEHPEPIRSGQLTSAMTTNGGVVVDDHATVLAVTQLLEAWTTQSTGRAEIVCVEGTHLDALGSLGVKSARIAEITTAEALASLAWAGASGAARGRRRGMAIGRFSMWWVLGAVGDLHDVWPPTNDEITELLGSLRWYRWDAHEPAGGWRLQLVVTDESEGLSWVINATDHS
jgi:hypothetical protein